MSLEFRKTVKADYPDIITAEAITALEALAPFDAARKALMIDRIERRADRARKRELIGFLDAESTIGGTSIGVRDARAGNFTGGDIPHDLRRQWIQGTGPAARPGVPLEVFATELQRRGQMAVWQYASTRGPQGELVMSPLQRIIVLYPGTARIEPYTSNLKVMPPTAR